MNYKVMVPAQIWQGYNSSSEPLQNEKTEYVGTVCEGIIEERHHFTALTKEDGDLRVAVRVLFKKGNLNDNPVLLMVGEYHRPPEEKLVIELAKAGYTIAIPDLSGVGEHKTTFPVSLEYGEFSKAGDHLKKVMPTAKETCQYLYSIIVKRTIIFVKRVISDGDLIVVGLGDAVEVAMQSVATEQENVKGLCCLNGAGYREYIKQTRYGEQKESALDEERMCWLTGVASVAYARYVKVPTFIAIGSNAINSDVDRLSNLVALMEGDDVHIAISPRATDFMLPEAYKTLLIWLKFVCENRVDEIPSTPKLSVVVGENGIPTFNVDCDPQSMIKKVSVYYASKEYHHALRNYYETEGLSVSYNEYIAEAEDYDENGALFAFAVVEYENGLSLSSLIEYMDLKGQPVRAQEKSYGMALNLIHQAGEEGGFVEECTGTVLFEKSLRVAKTPKGMVGLTSNSDGLTTYRFSPSEEESSSKILQLELYSDKSEEVEIVLLGITNDGTKTYTAKIGVQDTKGLFMSTRLRVTDFKDDRFMPLLKWHGVKSLSIRGKRVIVGNILFI